MLRVASPTDRPDSIEEISDVLLTARVQLRRAAASPELEPAFCGQLARAADDIDRHVKGIRPSVAPAFRGLWELSEQILGEVQALRREGGEA